MPLKLFSNPTSPFRVPFYLARPNQPFWLNRPITNVMVKFSLQGEAGEKKEGDLEEVKIDIETEDDEKKDAEKPEPPYSKYLNQLKEGGNACQLKYNALER